MEDKRLLTAAQQYITLLEDARQMAQRKDMTERLISGAPSTVSMKKKGERSLTEEDIRKLVSYYGSEEQKELVKAFPGIREKLSERLKNTKFLGLILERAELAYQNYFLRSKKPEKWKPEEMVRVMEVVKQLGL